MGWGENNIPFPPPLPGPFFQLNAYSLGKYFLAPILQKRKCTLACPKYACTADYGHLSAMDIFFSPGEQSTHSPLSFNLSSMASSPQGKRPLKHIAPLNCENNLLRFRQRPGNQRLGNSAYKTPFLLSPLRSRNLVQSVRLWSCPVYVHCMYRLQ